MVLKVRKRILTGVIPGTTLETIAAPSSSCKRGSMGNLVMRENQEYFGDKLGRKKPYTVRIILNNVNSLGLYAGRIKDEAIREIHVRKGGRYNRNY